jgi:hypothetical protein
MLSIAPKIIERPVRSISDGGNARLGVLEQVERSLKPGNRLATLMGAMLGGFIPLASYTIAHQEAPHKPVLWVLVACGLAYSALTVFDWARVAFRHPIKALGFCGLLEGVMTFSSTPWLGITALMMLIVINGIATGCNLVADRRQARSARVGNVRSAAGQRTPRNRMVANA